MKVRSKALYQYLLQANLLNGPEEAITQARKTYRKEYKQNWKRKTRPVKEIRYTLILKEFTVLQQQSRLANQKHTAFAKSALLNVIGKPDLSNDGLLEVLQSIGMAIIAFETGKPHRYAIDLLMQAEARLKQYLKVA